MRLLLIEDDLTISRPLSLALKTAGYALDTASDGERGYFLAATNPYDLIVLDYNLPKLNGREIIEKIRADQLNTPILMITVRSELDDKIDLLTLGADDYLTKPFSVSELLVRIKAVLRRPEIFNGHILKIGNLEMDRDKFLVTKNSRPIVLCSKEFALLEYFLLNPELVLSRQNIMEHVWDENADPFSNTIEVHVRNLRRKLETGHHKFIFTVPNRGYKLSEKK